MNFWRCPRCEYEPDPGDLAEVTEDRDLHIAHNHPDDIWAAEDRFVSYAELTHYWWVCRRCWDRMALSGNPAAVERDRTRHIENRHRGWQPRAEELALCQWPPKDNPTD